MNDENVHIGALLGRYVAQWKCYVPIGLVCLAAAVVFLLVTPRQYEFVARMQLTGEKEGMASELKMLKSTGLGGLLGGMSGSVNADNEVLMVKSRRCMAEAIRATGYQVEMRRWQGLKRVLLYGDAQPLQVSFPPAFLDTLSETLKLTIEMDGTRVSRVKAKSKLLADDIEVEGSSLPCRVSLPGGSAVTLSARPDVSLPAGKQTLYCRITPLQKVYEDLTDDLYVGVEESMSDFILLSVEDENKQRGRALLDALMAAFNHQSMSTKIREAGLNSTFVSQKLDTISRELSQLEIEIEAYQKQHNVPEPTLYAKAAMTGRQEVETVVLETEARLKMLDYVIGYLNDPANRYASVPALEGVGEESVALYNKLVLERRRLLMTSEAGNPALVRTEEQLDEQQKMLAEALAATRSSLRASLDEFVKKNHLLSARLDGLPTIERQYIEMKRQQKIKETMYLFLMQRLQENILVSSPDEQAARIIDPAYCSSKAVYPRKSITLLVALLVAFILSVTVISVRLLRRQPVTPQPSSPSEKS